MRDYISAALYSDMGYFNTHDVIHSPAKIDFGALKGQKEYTEQLAGLYKYVCVHPFGRSVVVFNGELALFNV